MDKEIIKILLHDFRDDIVKNNEKCSNINKDWDKSDSLKKAIEFKKLGIHVEADMDVKRKAFSSYCPGFLDEYITADIMNGWWTCVKILFDIKNIGDLKTNSYSLDDLNDEELKKSLDVFLKIAYTIGNITPAPINKHYDNLDSWEYKLSRTKELYHDYNYDKNKLLFQDYFEEGKLISNCKLEDFKNNPTKFIDNRVNLILKRGYRIVKKEKLEEKDLKNVIEYLSKS